MKTISKLIKDNKVLICFIMVLIIFILVIILLPKNKTESSQFKKEYESLNNKDINEVKYIDVNINNNSKIKYTDYNEINNYMKEKKSFVLYIGSPTCQYCRSAIEVLTEESLNYDVGDILYYSNDSNKSDYANVASLLRSSFVNDGLIKEPLVIFVIDGIMVSFKEGTVYSHTDENTKLSDSMREGLKNIYSSNLKLVESALNVSNQITK